MPADLTLIGWPSSTRRRAREDFADETVLAEAVKSRTKITELWEILQNTPIGLEIDQENSSPYGDAASFPRSLLIPKPVESDSLGLSGGLAT